MAIDLPEAPWGKIHNMDCVAGLQSMTEASVHLAFADPPFNIGYDYDVYDDQLESNEYLKWCGSWMRELHRVLRPDGTFWLAIGDEFAAELKVEACKAGFHLRSWVIWYYTFGVHCKNKFTRSHAHLFYFVKDRRAFCYHPEAIAVPSARQLIYNDKRANPKGRSPDDTWILRPQDCRDAFQPNEDIWYFPRVNGTFKERAGFHGCQMPEQLLGRIIRACSNPDDVVVDPFSGSATTLVVAKKLGRQFVGFELSSEYSSQGAARLKRTQVGDRLEGVEDPRSSVKSVDEVERARAGRKSQGKATKRIEEGFLPGFFDSIPKVKQSEILATAFYRASKGYGLERVLLDPYLNQSFQSQCDQLGVPGLAAERNRSLFRLRYEGVLTATVDASMDSSSTRVISESRAPLSWSFADPFLPASEIAWRRLSDRYPDSTLEELFCDPAIAELFDRDATSLAPGFSPLDYRLGALLLRYEWNLEQQRLDEAPIDAAEEASIDPIQFESVPFLDLRAEDLPSVAGVYRWGNTQGEVWYIGATECLSRRFQLHLARDSQELLARWLGPLSAVKVEWSAQGYDRTRPLRFMVSATNGHGTMFNIASPLS
ncbi:DNA adenine methyltransferase YhdJ [Pirellula sp. SH-Sr6A]|nr:DNA adenine methyltransferase YhdJ [Pirellula sp. SH-Sr6A]